MAFPGPHIDAAYGKSMVFEKKLIELVTSDINKAILRLRAGTSVCHLQNKKQIDSFVRLVPSLFGSPGP